MAEASPVRVAVLGAGAIGRRHADRLRDTAGAELAAIADPTEPARTFAAAIGAPWFATLADLLQTARPDAVIVATPNTMHVAHGMEVIAAGIPVLVEKPIADELEGARRLVDAAARAQVPLMVGHHRRHNPTLQAAKRAIESGRIGTVVAAHAMCWFHKPAGYFEPEWRRQPGAGPVLVNLIHDFDVLRYLCGEVAEVQAMESRHQRGHAVEDTAVLSLRFRSGALGTVTVSDTIAAPWSWELTSGENPDFTPTPEACIMVGGTLGSIAVPTLDIWAHAAVPDWMTPIARERLNVEEADPLTMQVRNLCDVVRGRAAPVVSGEEGLETLRVVLAAKAAAACGRSVRLD